MIRRGAWAIALAVALWPAASAAQAIPGARSYAAGREGWEAIRQGRHQEAADAFARALDTERRDPSLHLGSALAAYLLGHLSAAQQSLEVALSLAPAYTAASLLLGELLARGGDVAGALRVYEAAQVHAPADKTLGARVEALRRDAALHDAFYVSQGSHFTVLFEGPGDEQLARQALDILEAAYWRIATALSTFPERVITVVLYTEEQFTDITRAPRWAAGAYDGRIRIPVRGLRSDARELERVLGHEFVHALVQSVAPRGVPTWLNEGLAVAFEPEGSAWAARELATSPRRLPLQRLASGFAGLSGADARLAYAQSAAAVRLLLDEGGGPALAAMLQDLAAGETFGAAFERHLFLPYDSFVARVGQSAAP